MEGMEALHRQVAGIDVHRKSLSVCVRQVGADRKVRQEVRSFGTMTRDLLTLRDWLEAEGVTHVAMEATGVLWKPYDGMESQIGRLTERIEKVGAPFAPVIEKIVEVPGYNRTSAQNVVAEIGADMNQFPSDDPLCSWATICPGNRESAGKRKSGRTLQGNRWLQAALCQSAWSAVRTKGSYLGAPYHRLAGRRGKKRAIVAVAHTQLKVIYHLLRSGESDKDLGADYFLKLNGERAAHYHRKGLESLGYTVLPPSADKAA